MAALSDKSPAERLFEARDAYRSAFAMAILMMATPAVRTLAMWNVRSTSMAPTSGALFAIGLGMLVFLVSRRRRPEQTHALALTLIMTVPLLGLLPFTFVRWATLGRPWEAFEVAPFLFVCSALIIPRFFLLGTALNVAVLLEVLLGMHLQRRMGVLPELQPRGEPAITILFFVVGTGLVGLRAWRGRLIERHLRLEGEVLAMRRSAAQLQEVRGDFEKVLQRTAGELERATSQQSGNRHLAQMRRSLDRLLGTTRQLAELSEPPEATADREAALYAEDAQRGVMLLAGLFAFACPIFSVVYSDPDLGQLSRQLLVAGAIGFIAFVELVRTRRRPSAKRAAFWFLVLILPWFYFFAYAISLWSHQTRPAQAFVVPKIVMACMTLVVSGNRWIGRIVNAVLCVESFVLYYALGLSSLPRQVSAAEPWQTLLFAALGIALLSLGEERRLASVRILRAEAEQGALVRRTTIYLALRDQMNSPLQSLVLSNTLVGVHPELSAAIEQLVALARELPEERAVEGSGLVGPSLDGAEELRRRV
jgi:hypothetical protein